MKYWLLTTEYPPFHGGGISTYCHFTAEMLSARGFDVLVFVPDDAVADFICTEEKIGIRLLRFNSNRSDLGPSLGYTARLSYEFSMIVKTVMEKEERPDFIEAQDYLGIAYYLTQLKHLGYAFLDDIPIVLTLHSPAFVYLEYNRVSTYSFPDFWTCEMEKQAMRAADLLITPSRFIADEIQKYTDLSKKKLHLVANPYRSAGNEHPETFLRNKIVYYGKLSPQKGSFELLKYFKDLWDSGFPNPLYIIGGTDIVYHPEMQTMGQWVEKHYGAYIAQGLLRLLGTIQPKQIKEQLSDAHLIIVPSIVDNLPYVVMESMSLGKVVLASRNGGQREMIEDEVSGFLFDHDVSGDFAAKLSLILSLPDDEVQRIGSRACQLVKENFAFDVVASEKIGLLQQMTSKLMPKNYFPFLHQEKSIPLENYPIQDGSLTVVIPYYNMGQYIEECVGSVMASSYKDLRILIVNDGSSDPASIEKLKIFEGMEKIRVVHQKNQGLALTRNEGARQAAGTYLAFLDADDKVAPSYYEKTIAALKKNINVYFAGAWVQYFENSRRLWPTFTPQPPYLLVHNPVNSSGLVYKRAAFLQGGLNDKKTDYGLEDYESVVSMMHHGFNGVVIPEVLFQYRIRSGSMFRAISREKLLYSNKYILEKHAEYYTKFATQIVNLLNANGPGYLFDNPTLEVRINSRMIRENVVLLKIKSLIKGRQWLKKIVLSIKKIKR